MLQLKEDITRRTDTKKDTMSSLYLVMTSEPKKFFFFEFEFEFLNFFGHLHRTKSNCVNNFFSENWKLSFVNGVIENLSEFDPISNTLSVFWCKSPCLIWNVEHTLRLVSLDVIFHFKYTQKWSFFCFKWKCYESRNKICCK